MPHYSKLVLHLFLLLCIAKLQNCERSTCTDKRPNWCKKSLKNHREKLLGACSKTGSKVKTKFCCETCKLLTEKSIISESGVSKNAPVTQRLFYSLTTRSSSTKGAVLAQGFQQVMPVSPYCCRSSASGVGLRPPPSTSELRDPETTSPSFLLFSFFSLLSSSLSLLH